jgi:hypothetical protein
LFGLYDRIKNTGTNIQESDYEYSTRLRSGLLTEDLIGIYHALTYRVFIYSGATKDTTIVIDDKTKEPVSKVSYERDYGFVITKVEEFEDDKFILIYDSDPAIGTVLIHEDGSITAKRYDGEVFGRTIDEGSNRHTIQDIDLTFLFDTESSELELREEII